MKKQNDSPMAPVPPKTDGNGYSPEGIRINKLLASLGLGSRRQADEWIAAGRVRLNGTVLESPGARVINGVDSVELDGKEVNRTPDGAEPKDFTYVLLNKPIEVISTVRDPQGRKTVLDMLPTDLRQKRLYPVGRLDYFSEGLLLLTDDGEMTNRLTHPSAGHERVYMVKVRGRVQERQLEAMRTGMRLAEGEKLAPVEARILDSDHRSTLLQLVLHQGLNRQIRRMCRDLNLTILMLRRVQHGPLRLGELPPGKCRTLSAQEVRNLRTALGMPTA